MWLRTRERKKSAHIHEQSIRLQIGDVCARYTLICKMIATFKLHNITIKRAYINFVRVMQSMHIYRDRPDIGQRFCLRSVFFFMLNHCFTPKLLIQVMLFFECAMHAMRVLNVVYTIHSMCTPRQKASSTIQPIVAVKRTCVYVCLQQTLDFIVKWITIACDCEVLSLRCSVWIFSLSLKLNFYVTHA